jgi:hypothetical protein
VRRELDPLFRVDEGVLMVEVLADGLHSIRYRPSYQPADLETLYPGLATFLDARAGRDVVHGKCQNESGWSAVTPLRVGP